MQKTALIAIFLSFFCLVNLAWGEMDVQETTRLAKSGDANAQYNLGIMYYNGEGTPKNFINSYVWLSVASAKGNEKAKKYIEIISSEMTPQQVAQAQNEAAELWKRINKSKK